MRKSQRDSIVIGVVLDYKSCILITKIHTGFYIVYFYSIYVFRVNRQSEVKGMDRHIVSGVEKQKSAKKTKETNSQTHFYTSGESEYEDADVNPYMTPFPLNPNQICENENSEYIEMTFGTNG